MQTAARIALVALFLASAVGLARADQLRPLINDLKSKDMDITLRAIKGLGESGDLRAVSPLLDALHDERGVVRQYAVEALQHLVQTLDEVYIVVKRWLQSLVNKLRLDPSDEMITVEQPGAHSSVAQMGKAAPRASVAVMRSQPVLPVTSLTILRHRLPLDLLAKKA
jgi:HEAT repeats